MIEILRFIHRRSHLQLSRCVALNPQKTTRAQIMPHRLAHQPKGIRMFKLLRTTFRQAGAVLSLIAASSSIGHAQVTNGSFETPTVTPATFTLFPVTGSPSIP